MSCRVLGLLVLHHLRGQRPARRSEGPGFPLAGERFPPPPAATIQASPPSPPPRSVPQWEVRRPGCRLAAWPGAQPRPRCHRGPPHDSWAASWEMRWSGVMPGRASTGRMSTLRCSRSSRACSRPAAASPAWDRGDGFQSRPRGLTMRLPPLRPTAYAPPLTSTEQRPCPVNQTAKSISLASGATRAS